jgi:hypothetical protein
MNMLTLTLLPTDVVRHIYFRWYFPSVIEELQEKVPRNNRFVVHSHSLHRDNVYAELFGLQTQPIVVVQIEVPLGRLYIYPSITLELYREGVSSNPEELGRCYFSRLATVV